MAKMDQKEAQTYIEGLIAKSKKAFKEIEYYSQEQVDHLIAVLSWKMDQEDVRQELANLAYEETQLGDIPSKLAKVDGKIRGVYSEIKNRKTVGVIEEDKELGLVKIAKPAGVVGALIPSTQPEMIPITTALFCIKCRDTAIFAPHPRGKNVGKRVTEMMREIIAAEGAPADILQCIDPDMLSVTTTQELMKQADLVMATGGAGMVKAAYSSGTPAYGVGAGNSVMVVDETADLDEMARKIKMSKTFDLAAGCSCENQIILLDSIYDDAIAALEKVGAYLTKEHDKIQAAIFPTWPADHNLNRNTCAKPVSTIAEIAGIDIPEDTAFILVEETGVGHDHPLSGEKLCLVTTVFRAKTIKEATDLCNRIHEYSGAGHSAGIYSYNQDNINYFALHTHTVRVNNNLPNATVNTGSWMAGYPFSPSVGCGTWGGNSCSQNVTIDYYMNYTYLATEISRHIPTTEELWGDTGVM